MTAPRPSSRFIQGEERWAQFRAHGYRMRYLYVKAATPSRKPPVVFIHGFLGYSFSWRFNLLEFARERDVYAVDLLGMGFSDRPPRGAVSYTMADSANRLLGWMQDLGLWDADLVATSHGGALAMTMAALDEVQKRHCIGRLVLVAPANPYSTRGRKRLWFFNTAIGAAILKAFGGLSLIKDLSLDFMYGDRSKLTPETRAGYQFIMDDPTSFDYALDVIKTWWPDMHAITANKDVIADVPTLLVWGDRDRTVPVRTAEMVAGDFRNTKLVLMHGSGHMPYEESPEEFNRIILDWLDGLKGTA